MKTLLFEKPFNDPIEPPRIVSAETSTARFSGLAGVFIHFLKNIRKMLSAIGVFLICTLSVLSTPARAASEDENNVIAVLEYIAAYPDLIAAFGVDWEGASYDYYLHKNDPDRTKRFSGCDYVASQGSLIKSYGTDFIAALRYYITTDRNNSYFPFDGEKYKRLNPRFQANSRSELLRLNTIDDTDPSRVACLHAIENAELIAFEEAARLPAGTYPLYERTSWGPLWQNYLQTGIDVSYDQYPKFEPCNYIASYQDLIWMFNGDQAAGAYHYLQTGRGEGRTISFNGYKHMIANPDVLGAIRADSEGACSDYIQRTKYDKHKASTDNKIIVGLANKCMDAGAGYVASQGSQIVMYDCRTQDTPQHRWQFRADGKIVGIGGTNCITPSNWSLDNGSLLIMWPCAETNPKQSWQLNAFGDIVNSTDPNKCIDIVGVSSSNGAPLNVYDCWNGSNQKWSVSEGIKLVGLAGKCLNANTTTAQSVPVSLWDCVANQKQQEWIFDRGQIRGIGNLCLSVDGPIATLTPLNIKECVSVNQIPAKDSTGQHIPTGQKWFLKSDGNIAVAEVPGQCINVFYGDTSNGATVGLYPCQGNGNPNDTWAQK